MQFRHLAFHHGLEDALKAFPVLSPESFHELVKDRSKPAMKAPSLPDSVSHTEFTFAGPDDNELTLSVLRRKSDGADEALRGFCIYHIHGGGMITGTRLATLTWPLEAVEQLGVTLVSIEYRLAPEHPDPAPVEDCYAGLVWVRENAAKLGINPERILLQGASAGAGLAAGVALLCRDRSGPQVIGQALFAPMLDDRNDTCSAYQFEGLGVWDRKMNEYGWTCLLGDRRGTKDVSIYASPARATDLSGLPPAYIDVGSAETFRDESVAYASRLWRDGVQCELHVWPGAFHGFDGLCPEATLSITAQNARLKWLKYLIQSLDKHESPQKFSIAA